MRSSNGIEIKGKTSRESTASKVSGSGSGKEQTDENIAKKMLFKKGKRMKNEKDERKKKTDERK